MSYASNIGIGRAQTIRIFAAAGYSQEPRSCRDPFTLLLRMFVCSMVICYTSPGVNGSKTSRSIALKGLHMYLPGWFRIVGTSDTKSQLRYPKGPAVVRLKGLSQGRPVQRYEYPFWVKINARRCWSIKLEVWIQLLAEHSKST